MSQKLESIQKILLATGTINYLANAMNGVNTEIKFIPDQAGIYANGIQERESLLSAAVADLSEVMENLADYMNSADCISAIDVTATEAAFRILIEGHDDVDDDHEEVAAPAYIPTGHFSISKD